MRHSQDKENGTMNIPERRRTLEQTGVLFLLPGGGEIETR
nr:MAG TPA: hypothetical protein [Caudoviricetes sp.]